MSVTRDWADRDADEIIFRVLKSPSGELLTDWLAAKLRTIREEGVGEGIDRLGKALSTEVGACSGASHHER